MARIRSNYWGGVTTGTAGDDDITGSSLSDVIFAGSGADIIHAGLGDDVIDGGAGADQIDGGDGYDTVIYSNAPRSAGGGFTGFGVPLNGVIVDLQQDRGFLSDAQGDTFTSIENAVGSAFNDVLIGDGGRNVLSGLNGDDTIYGGGGADTMDGGNGIDTLDYLASTAGIGVIVNLLTGTGNRGDAAGDSFRNFENVKGTQYDDILIGDDRDNSFVGYMGNDTIDAGRGNDTLIGGIHIDTMLGGAGNDRLEGFEGDDILSGGTDADTFVFELALNSRPGNDRITDFEAGIDTIEIHFNGLDRDISELNFRNSGSDIVITYDHNPGSITLVGAAGTTLHQSDFHFV